MTELGHHDEIVSPHVTELHHGCCNSVNDDFLSLHTHISLCSVYITSKYYVGLGYVHDGEENTSIFEINLGLDTKSNTCVVDA